MKLTHLEFIRSFESIRKKVIEEKCILSNVGMVMTFINAHSNSNDNISPLTLCHSQNCSVE